MDITQRFKAAVMAVKVQRKGDFTQPTLDKNRILPTKSPHLTSQRDEFAKQAHLVCNKITTLRNVLLENRAAYMRIGQHLKNAVQMTDQERDVIDRESEKFIAYYTQHLGQMRSDWKRTKRKAQQQEHIDAVLDLLGEYLRSVQQIYLEQKKYRVQHELETYKLLKLAADKKKIPIRPVTAKKPADEVSNGKAELDASSDSDAYDEWQSENEEPVKPKADNTDWSNASPSTSNQNTESKSQSSQKIAIDEDIRKEEAEAAKELSPEDVQMFEEENVQLYHELQGLSEEVELIEKNVVDIAQLQDIFTEKVAMQQHNIERIANAVVGATENVKDANEQIKQAIQRNAGLRVWSLFFLLVMSFALLFLDWYYD